MHAAARKFGLVLGLLVGVVLSVSCAGQHHETATYGTPGPGKIQIYLSGPGVRNKGFYYLPKEATLESALLTADTEHDAVIRRVLIITRVENGESVKKRYNVLKLSVAEKAEVLHDKDFLFLPCTLW